MKDLSENVVIEKKQDAKSMEANADFGRTTHMRY